MSPEIKEHNIKVHLESLIKAKANGGFYVLKQFDGEKKVPLSSDSQECVDEAIRRFNLLATEK